MAKYAFWLAGFGQNYTNQLTLPLPAGGGSSGQHGNLHCHRKQEKHLPILQSTSLYHFLFHNSVCASIAINITVIDNTFRDVKSCMTMGMLLAANVKQPTLANFHSA